MDKFLTINELCDALKVSRVAVWEWMRSGKLKAYRAGRSVRIREEDLLAFMQEWNPRKKRIAKTKRGPKVRAKSNKGRGKC
jgi:excisionase family DNA binding protein